jgi:hypothetical protein
MTIVPRFRNYDPALLNSWREGAREFNEGRYWDAHEKWEQGWKELPEPERSWVQAWIQLAGAIYLRQKGRPVPSKALCRSALSKLEGAREMLETFPRLEVVGGWSFLERSLTPDQSQDSVSALKARLLTHPGM